MITINNHDVPTCSELAEQLKVFGDKPLFSGQGWFAVNGFTYTKEGPQILAIKCPPRGIDAYDQRKV